MKVIYIIIVLAILFIVLLGGSIWSTTNTIKETVRSAASELQGQRGGKRASSLRMLMFLLVTVAVIVYILTRFRVDSFQSYY